MGVENGVRHGYGATIPVSFVIFAVFRLRCKGFLCYVGWLRCVFVFSFGSCICGVSRSFFPLAAEYATFLSVFLICGRLNKWKIWLSVSRVLGGKSTARGYCICGVSEVLLSCPLFGMGHCFFVRGMDCANGLLGIVKLGRDRNG